jgi:PAS domain S-box-containing protein
MESRIARMNIRFGSWCRHRERPRSLLIRYSRSLLVVLVAIGLRLWLDSSLERAGFAISLTGMLAAAWIGGVGPCLIAQTMTLFAEAIWFNPAHEVHSPATARGIVSLIAFYSVGVTVAALSEAWQAARRRANAEKNEAIAQREQLCATLACVGDGVLVTDEEGRLTLMNPVAETMTGWTLAESKGKPVRDVFAICDEKSQDLIENPVYWVLREGRVLQDTMRLILTTRNDRRLPVAYSAAPVRALGKITGVVLILRDETERRRAELALRSADQRKDEFLATLAHELRNPLAPICMGLELMKVTDHDDHDEVDEVRSMMERQTRHMVRLIDDLLDVSRITRGKLELRRCQVRLDEVVRNAVDATRPAIEEAGHRLFVKLPKRPILLDADPNRLTQILSNLLSNAAKYTPNGGRIELAAAIRNGEIIVSVSDNGRGIPPNMLDEIFEMFAQAHRSEIGDQKGLGIGLTLVKRLVELHGGTVEVESGGHGSGSRFCVRLPALPLPSIAKKTSPRKKERHRPMQLNRRVLVVDDNVDALTSMSMLVRLMGNTVLEARDGLEAIEVAERFQPDIILMDLGMPNLNGYDAAKRIRAQSWGSDVVLVATTGWGQQDDRRRTKDAGFDHHLVKPIEVAKLEELLEGRAHSLEGGGNTAPSRIEPELFCSFAMSEPAADKGSATKGEHRLNAVPK